MRTDYLGMSRMDGWARVKYLSRKLVVGNNQIANVTVTRHRLSLSLSPSYSMVLIFPTELDSWANVKYRTFSMGGKSGDAQNVKKTDAPLLRSSRVSSSVRDEDFFFRISEPLSAPCLLRSSTFFCLSAQYYVAHVLWNVKRMLRVQWTLAWLSR